MKTVFLGEKFHRLTVSEKAPTFRRKDGHGIFIMWKCICDCGNATVVRANNLANGTTKSCGCLKKEVPQVQPKGPGSGFTRVYAGYQWSAKKRNREFALTENQFRALTLADCHYCNSRPSKIMKTSSKLSIYVYNGIDRVDNKIGYIVGNCVSCCECCNKAKGTKTYDEFIAWINRLIKYRSSL